ncbi:putative tetratricopeptide TPR_2 repeat protein [Treponema primitia ZAS-2]|uniref:Putative tetratricopeptide TPR_2 repeat protein n=1 Tax=Treponema primitia (strain ATCC BAA-887 / DSM 12427 / ZAS-2) TaxID=545694 RepID=F5YI13_TREPZ|nr:transglutaminase-like domain-containing protein [Treponema primitia]AEF84021.1 putative tetratricopeptide TPR_2 repeat protein [Treponema primitia ZAS-2]
MKKNYKPVNHANSITFFLLFALFGSLVVTSPLFAESEFKLRLAPRLMVPAGSSYFDPGFGAAAAFDWDFLQWSLPPRLGRDVSFGVFAGAAYASIAAAANGNLTMIEGKLGPSLLWRISDRLTFGLDAGAGVYNYSFNGTSAVKPLAGLGLSAYFHLLPSLSLYTEGGYTWHGFSDTQTIHGINIGLGLSLNLGEILWSQTRVSGERLRQELIFPVSFAWYEKNSIASVRITNNEKNAITDLRLSFMLERYMNQDYQFATRTRLGPGESAEFPVTALFNETMLDLTENINANTRITLEYRSLGAKKTMSFPAFMTIYHRNAFTWDDDRRAASFVSAKDPAAAYFANFTAQGVERFLRENPSRFSATPKNILLAAALFETLNLYGINYVVDPSSSFIELSENASALDSLNYPYQTLFYRGGDCDDLSILFCSLLEALGIESAFVTVPGHIYIAFDVGVLPEDDAVNKGQPVKGAIEQEGRLWLPVEITIPHGGFLNAVEIGAQEWNGAGGAEDTGGGDQSGIRALYPMGESWQVYRSVSVPGAGDRMPEMPDEEEILRAFADSMTKFIRK